MTTKKAKQPEYAKNISELARYLGASYDSLRRHLAKPGSPIKSKQGYNVKECRKWYPTTANKYAGVQRVPRKVDGEPEAAADTDDENDGQYDAMSFDAMKRKELAEKIKKLEISNAKESEQLIEIGVAVDLWGEFAEAVRKVIENSGLDDIEKDRCFEALVRATRKLHEKHARAMRNDLAKTGAAESG